MTLLSVLPEVWDDLDEAALWYDRNGGQELGDRLVSTFDDCLVDLIRYAGTHRLVYRQFSRVFAKPFPYAVYFRIHENQVVVT